MNDTIRCASLSLIQNKNQRPLINQKIRPNPMLRPIQKLSSYSLITLLLSSCGSLQTLGKNDIAVQKEAKQIRTKCGTISRVYSGLVFDFCVLHSEPKTFKKSGITIEGEVVIISIFIDMILSGLVDTVALPYTAPQQLKYGSIVIEPNAPPSKPATKTKAK